jgi:hypothetical protein
MWYYGQNCTPFKVISIEFVLPQKKAIGFSTLKSHKYWISID